MKLRDKSSRGYLKNDWIESRRLFSNNSYWNPNYMNWELIKVINDDILQPGFIIPSHEHKNLDILGYLVGGKLEHTDSTGIITTASVGQIQHMKCGDSIYHTEKCISDIPARYLQIWITPDVLTSDSYYEIINKELEFGPILIDYNKNIKIEAGVINGYKEFNISNKGLMYIIGGEIVTDEYILEEGDSVEFENEIFKGTYNNAHILLFKLDF